MIKTRRVPNSIPRRTFGMHNTEDGTISEKSAQDAAMRKVLVHTIMVQDRPSGYVEVTNWLGLVVVLYQGMRIWSEYNTSLVYTLNDMLNSGHPAEFLCATLDCNLGKKSIQLLHNIKMRIFSPPSPTSHLQIPVL